MAIVIGGHGRQASVAPALAILAAALAILTDASVLAIPTDYIARWPQSAVPWEPSEAPRVGGRP